MKTLATERPQTRPQTDRNELLDNAIEVNKSTGIENRDGNN
jgi:hypothetical protein